MSAVARSVDDAELTELLELRAGRAKVDPALLGRVTAVAVTEPQARPSAISPIVLSIGRARRAAAALVAVAAAISLVGAALFVGSATRKAAEVSPSASVAGRSESRFTSVDFLRFLRDQPDGFIGHTVLVDGTLSDANISCVRLSVDCPPLGIAGSDPGDPYVLPADQAVRDEIGPAAVSVSGTFAIQVRSASDLRLLGRVQAPPAGDWWRPSELRATPDTSLYAVDGWLVRGQIHPCPSIPASPGATPGPPFGCPNDEYLTDEPYQPVQPNGSERGPAHAAYLPAGTYASLGGSTTGRTVEPRHGVYLLRSAGCGNPCGGITDWVAIGMVDPVTLAVPSPEPSSVAQREPTVLEEAALPAILPTLPAGTTILVRGTLVDTSGKSCHGDDCSVAGFKSIVDEVGVLAGADMVTPASGTFAMRVVNATAVRYVDTVVPNGDHISWRPPELATYGPPSGTAYVVTGWLVPGDSSACPPAPDGSSGCDTRAPQLVEDEAAARQLAVGQKVESLMLKSVAEAAESTESGPAVYVVRAAQRTCNDLGGHAIPDCFVSPSAPVDLYVDARVDPIETADATPSVTPGQTTLASPFNETAVTILPPVADPFIGEGNEFVNDAVAYGDGFVAAGYLYSLVDGHRSGNVWISPDGLAWEKVAPPELDGIAVDGIVAFGSHLLLHGVARASDRDPGEGRLFVSEDGHEWTQVTTSALGSSVDASIVAGPTGFMALVHVGQGLRWQGWTSNDGLAWRRTSLPDSVQGSLVTLSGWEAGYALAITEGSELNTPWPSVHDRHVELAVSDDATSWRTANVPGATGVGRIYGTSDALIAVGGEGYCGSCISQPVTWRSDDRGATWSKLEDVLTIRDAVTAGRDRFFVWSFDSVARLYRLRESQDGVAWREIAVFEEARSSGRDAIGGIGWAIGATGILGFDQTNAQPAHQVAVLARFGPPPAGAYRVSPAPEPSDRPCLSPMPRDSDGACGP